MRLATPSPVAIPRAILGQSSNADVHQCGGFVTSPAISTTVVGSPPGRDQHAKYIPAPPRNTERASESSLFRDWCGPGTDPRGRRSEHARARVLPKRNCIADVHPRSYFATFATTFS